MGIASSIAEFILDLVGVSATKEEIEKNLDERAKKWPEKLNWRESIVDLMKLSGQDSSLSARKELAKELGYTGKLDGSAEMNIWLHARVMEQVAKKEM